MIWRRRKRQSFEGEEKDIRFKCTRRSRIWLAKTQVSFNSTHESHFPFIQIRTLLYALLFTSDSQAITSAKPVKIFKLLHCLPYRDRRPHLKTASIILAPRFHLSKISTELITMDQWYSGDFRFASWSLTSVNYSVVVTPLLLETSWARQFGNITEPRKLRAVGNGLL